MLKPKKLLNDPNNVRREVMKGLLYTYNGRLKSVEEYCAVYRESISHEQVIIVSGRGSGHESTFAGFIGDGGIDA